MIKDNFNILKTLNEKRQKTINIKELENSVISGFKEEILSSSDDILLELVFSKNPEQKDLDKFLKNWDIEVVGGHKALMLAYFMKMHPEFNYPDYVKPRLNGLLQFYRFHNMKLISGFIKICTELRKNNINDLLIIKGGAMKHFRPELPRVMSDIDILVRDKDFEKAGHVAENMGYGADWQLHSIDLHPKGTEEGLLDIHKYIDMRTGHEKGFSDKLFGRAFIQNVFGIENVLIPSMEDMLFISVINLIKNLTCKTSSTGVLYTLFDCKYIIEAKPDFDWNIVVENAKNTKTELQLHLGIKFINSFIPNLLPDELLKNKKLEKEFYNYCIKLFYKRFYLWEMKERSHNLKIRDAIKKLDLIKEYLSFKPKYFILKRSIIRNNPGIVKLILKKENRLV